MRRSLIIIIGGYIDHWLYRSYQDLNGNKVFARRNRLFNDTYTMFGRYLSSNQPTLSPSLHPFLYYSVTS